MATATIEAPAIYSGRFHADGRAVTVTPELLALHRRCGGGEGDPIALPGLPSLIRRAVALSMPLSAPVLLADGPNNVTYWARVVPDGEEADLQLFDWNGTGGAMRSEEHTSELQSLMRISYAVFCLKKKKKTNNTKQHNRHRTSYTQHTKVKNSS